MTIADIYDSLRDDRGIYLYKNNDPNDLIEKICILERATLMILANPYSNEAQDILHDVALEYRDWRNENETKN